MAQFLKVSPNSGSSQLLLNIDLIEMINPISTADKTPTQITLKSKFVVTVKETLLEIEVLILQSKHNHICEIY